MKHLNFLSKTRWLLVPLMLLTLSVGQMWGTVLFHETFGNNTGSSAVNWNNNNSVKSGVSAVYSGVSYTVTNAKQTKNTNGSTQSGLQNTTSSNTQQVASFVVGPLSVANYTSLAVSYQWKASSIRNNTYYAKLYYKTSSNGTFTEVTGSGNGATSYVTRSFSLPAAAQVSTLYLKAEWYTSNTTAFIDEFELTGTASTPSCTAPTSPNISGTADYTVGQTISLTASASNTDGSTTYQWYKGDPDNGGTSQGAASTSGATFTKANCVAGDAATYYCVISNGTGCTAKVSKTVTVSAAIVAVTGVSLNKASTSIEVGSTETLTATVSPNNATNKNVMWESSNTNIATVDAGVVTAVAAGSATITCKSASDATKTATCTVTVTPAPQYKKVTSDLTDWSGEYLLVYENSSTQAYVWTGIDAGQCYATATISNSKITKPANGVKLTVEALTGDNEGKYSLKVVGGTNNGKYVGRNTTGNGLNIVADVLANTISYSTTEGNVGVVINSGQSTTMRFNSATGANNLRFRYYGSGQQPVQLYRKVVTSAVTITDPAEGKGTLTLANGQTPVADGANVDAGTQLTVTATPNSGNHYIGGTIVVKKTSDQSDVTNEVLSGTTLTMPEYAITVSATFTPTYLISTVANGGSIELSYTKGDAAEGYAAAGTAVTATATADGTHTFTSIAVSENAVNPSISSNVATFTMPEGAVTVTATFAVKEDPAIAVKNNVTSLTFGPVADNASCDAQTFTISGSNLEAGKLTVASNSNKFVVSSTALDENGQMNVEGTLAETVITVTPVIDGAGVFNGKITISGGGLKNAVEITLSLTVQQTYTAQWIVNGDTEHPVKSTTAVKGTALEFPAVTPSGTCAGTEFKGWLTAPLTEASATEPAGLITTYTGYTMPEDGVNYYAVFAEQVSDGTEAGYSLSASAPAEEDGNVIIATKSGNTYYAVGTDQSAHALTLTDGLISSSTSNIIWYLSAGTNDGLYYADGTGNTPNYIHLNKSSFNVTTSTTNGELDCISNEDGSYKLKVVNSQNVRYLTYSTSYSVTDNAASATPIYIFKYSAATDPTYSNYVTTCVACSNVSLVEAGETNGTITLKEGSKAVNSVKTCNGAVTLTTNAVAATGYELTDITLSGVANVTKNEALTEIYIPKDATGELTVTATFSQKNYSVTMEQVGGANATLSADQTNKHYGELIEISTTEPAGYEFGGWYMYDATDTEKENDLYESIFTGDYEEDYNKTTAHFYMPERNLVAVAYFDKIYSVSEFAALSKTDGTKYLVEGIVSSVQGYYSSKYITYFISVDGKNENTLKIYNGLDEGGENFSASTDLKVGDKVRVYGAWSATNSRIDDSYLTLHTVGAHASYEIAGNLTQDVFVEGATFLDSYMANLKVNDVYNTSYKVEVDDVTFSADKTTLTTSDEVVHVTATKNASTLAEKDFTISVSAATMVSFELKEGYKTSYFVGQTFVKPTVVATLSDNSHVEAEATACIGYNMSAADTYDVTVSFTYGTTTLNNVQYQITVRTIANDLATAYTASEAKDIIENVYASTTESGYDVYVRGIAVGDPNNEGTYFISNDGSASNQVQIYKGKYFDSSVSAKDNVKAGDELVVKGHILVYSNAAEMKSSTVVYQLREGALTVNNVTEFEVGQPDLAEANLTINRHGSTGAITFSCAENEALEIVENKLRAKGEATADVTVTATMAADNTEGQINFTEASTIFTVHVVPAQVRYAVTFDLNGGSAEPMPSLGNQLENADVEIPAGTFTKDGYKFNGWAVTYVDANEQVQNVTVTKTGDVYSFKMPAAAVTVTAQWVEGSDFTWVASDKGYENAQDITTATAEADPISIVFAKETAQNGPKYYTSGTAVRTYAGNTVTITTKSDTKLINKITFTYGNKDVAADGLSEDKLTWTGLAKTVVLTAGSGQAHFKTITVTYLNGTVTTLDIENVSLMLTAGTKDLSISCNVTPTPAISYEIAEADQAIATVADGVVTAHSIGGPINVTASIAQGENYTAAIANFTITVTDKTPTQMSFPQASYDAYLGSDFEEPALTTDPEGIAVTYSSSVPGVATVNENTGEIELVGEGETVITAAFAGDDDYSANSAIYTLNVADPNKDVLTAEKIAVTGSYANWSDKTFGSGIKYAGNSTTGTSGNAGAIQMRVSSGTQEKSGIVTTTAIGYLKSISATLKSGTNKLYIYAKGSAYESAADLYDNEKQGTHIGTITDGAMVFEEGKAYADNYKYIGIKANGGAVYYDDITITWEPAVFEHFDVTYQAGEVSADPVVESIEEGSIISLKAADTFTAPEGKIFAGWLLEGEQNVREAGSKYTVTAAATFTAQWISVYTITYLPGEAEGEPVVVENVPVGNYSLAANTFETPESKEFAGWKLNNEGDVLAANSDFEVTANAEFTAQWSIVKQQAGLAYTTTSYMITRGRSFVAPELTKPNGLIVAYSGNNDEVATVDAATGAITLKGGIGTITVTATSAETDYYYAGEASYTLKVKDANLSGGWVRLTNANTLVAGMKVIVAQYVSSQNGTIKTMGGQNTNNRAEVAGTLQNDTLISDEGTEILTLVAIKNTTNFALKTADNKYLYAAGSGSGKNYLKSKAKVDGDATWAISLSADGKATITAQGDNTNNKMQYNQSNTLFSCYASTSQKEIALYSKTIAVSEGEMNASTLDEYADVVVAGDATLVINEGTKPLGNITGNVTVNAPLQAEGVHLGVNNTMEVNSTVNVPSFSISVQLGSTGQATNVNVDVEHGGSIAAPEGYVDMELSNDANPDQWHAFTVPFEVDALNGIYDAETGAPLQNEVNYAIMDYHGDIRAQGKYGWKKYRGTLKPGVFYLITVDGESKVLRFMKKEGSSYVAPNYMAMKYYGDNNPENTNNGWCGVGNQNMFGGYVPFKAQILNSTGTGYDAYNANTTKFSACIPFFIQIESDDNLAVSTTLPSSVAARRVAAKGINDIKVTFGNENYSDKLYISANEDAKNAYEVGKDLVKMTMSNTPVIPQIFGKAYGNKLCMVYAPMSNDQAVYDLSLYAPANGEYTIAAPEVENADLYLTKDGAIIWNLTMSEYPINLNKGTTEGYGLLLKAKAPQTPTGVEQSEVSRQPSDIQKIIINDNVFILRGGKMYDVTGKAVK